MEPITREEYYLAKIAGTYKGKTPEPVTIDEYYLATMAGDYSGNTPQPVTRLQYYMAKVAGVWGGSIPAPVTRLEYYWAAIASGEGKVFPPVTREEHFLVLVADAYSVVLTVVTGKPAQTLIIPTPNGLSGIPVSSGGNYTDADGQQWVCDEVDFKKGVYVQRVATETPKAKWKNFEETADVPNRYRISGALVNRYRNGSTKCLISHGIYANWGIAPGWALNSTTFYYHPKEDVTKEEAKEQILGFINSANPLTFLGQLETPIEKPLTTEQLATYKALRTYSPTTTVANDAEAG